jgi:3-methyladenine DNA glycosylase Mpg
MQAKPGNLYLYRNGRSKNAALSINISCDREGFGSAVLIRSIRPLDQDCADVMREYRLVPRGVGKELRGENFMKILANGPAKVGDALGLTSDEHANSEKGRLSIFHDPFELYHPTKSWSPLPTVRVGLERMHQKFIRNEPERANHPDAKAHMQRQWRWALAAYDQSLNRP